MTAEIIEFPGPDLTVAEFEQADEDPGYWARQAFAEQLRRGLALVGGDLVKATALASRIDSRTEVNADGCLVWTGARNRDGYGRIAVGRRDMRAHRVVAEIINGAIPEGTELDHLCRNRPCVHPDHVEPVTHAENLQRGDNANREKTHCPAGHDYAEHAVTYHCADGRTRRFCRQCRTERDRLRTAPTYVEETVTVRRIRTPR